MVQVTGAGAAGVRGTPPVPPRAGPGHPGGDRRTGEGLPREALTGAEPAGSLRGISSGATPGAYVTNRKRLSVPFLESDAECHALARVGAPIIFPPGPLIAG